MKIDQFQHKLAVRGEEDTHIFYVLKGKCSPGQLPIILCKTSLKQDKLLRTKSF